MSNYYEVDVTVEATGLCGVYADSEEEAQDVVQDSSLWDVELKDLISLDVDKVRKQAA